MSIQEILHLIPKETYYNTKNEVVAEARKNHQQLFEQDRTLYTYLLYFTKSTYFSKSLILQNLLQNSLHKKEYTDLVENDGQLLQVENALIRHALFNENTTHAIKMLLSLKKERVNNSRTRNVILDFIFNRGNGDFIAIKYKKKMKDLVIHALGLSTVNAILDGKDKEVSRFHALVKEYNNPFAMEIFNFLFDKEVSFNSSYLKEYVRVKHLFKEMATVELKKETPLPVEVLIGFNNFYKRQISIPSLFAVGNVSEKQKIQSQNLIQRHSNNKMELKVDFTKFTILELYKYLYSKKEIDMNEVKQCLDVIEQKAKEIRQTISEDFMLDLSNTAVILDVSDSHAGSGQTLLHPLFKNLALSNVLADKDKTFVVGGVEGDNGLLYPNGDSDLSTTLLDVASAKFKNVIVLSDGFENVHSFDKVYKQLKHIGVELNVIHFNPVFSPKNFSFKTLSDEVTTLPFSNVEDLEELMLLHSLSNNAELFKSKMRQKIEAELLNK